MTTILIVEDDTPLMRLYESTLYEESYNVLSVGTAANAIKAIDEHIPEVVVLDLNLPDRPGTEVIDYIVNHAQLSHTHIVVMTGFSRFNRESFPEQVLQVLNKPVTPSMLLRVVRDAIASNIQS